MENSKSQKRNIAAQPRFIFSIYEIDLLTELISKKINVIKCINGYTTNDRKRAFNEITAKFNGSPRVHKRTVEQIKNWYKNHKSRIFKRGGAEEQQAPPPNGLKLEFLEFEAIKPLDTPFDSDAVLKKESESVPCEGTIPDIQDEGVSYLEPETVLSIDHEMNINPVVESAASSEPVIPVALAPAPSLTPTTQVLPSISASSLPSLSPALTVISSYSATGTQINPGPSKKTTPLQSSLARFRKRKRNVSEEKSATVKAAEAIESESYIKKRLLQKKEIFLEKEDSRADELHRRKLELVNQKIIFQKLLIEKLRKSPERVNVYVGNDNSL